MCLCSGENTTESANQQMEAQSKIERFNAKIDTLRGVLVANAAHESKEKLLSIASNISCAFDKITVDSCVESPDRMVSTALFLQYSKMSKQQCSAEAERLVRVASEKGNIFSLLPNLLILENIYNSAK